MLPFQTTLYQRLINWISTLAFSCLSSLHFLNITCQPNKHCRWRCDELSCSLTFFLSFCFNLHSFSDLPADTSNSENVWKWLLSFSGSQTVLWVQPAFLEACPLLVCCRNYCIICVVSASKISDKSKSNQTVCCFTRQSSNRYSSWEIWSSTSLYFSQSDQVDITFSGDPTEPSRLLPRDASGKTGSPQTDTESDH